MKESSERDARISSELTQRVVEDASGDHSSDQLLEVVRFLRKEKEISDARVDVVTAESARFKQRVEVLDKQLAEANASLQEERERSQVTLPASLLKLKKMMMIYLKIS